MCVRACVRMRISMNRYVDVDLFGPFVNERAHVLLVSNTNAVRWVFLMMVLLLFLLFSFYNLSLCVQHRIKYNIFMYTHENGCKSTR